MRDLRPGPRRFAYADPPYPGNAKWLYGDHPDYGGEVDHRELVARLVDEFPDGWALSTSALSLRDVWALCPADTRVGLWLKSLVPLKPSAGVQWGWEPVLLRGGRPRTLNDGIVNDYLICPPARHKVIAGGIIGMKPREFSWWVFRMLGAQRDDEFLDLFPGSGAVATAWSEFVARPELELDVEQQELVG